MDLAVTRRYVVDRGTWLRAPSELFILTSTIWFSEEERWAIDAHNLYHHVILDRTPPWYFSGLREAERAKERAEREGSSFQWPEHVPPAVPAEWVLTVAQVLRDPTYTVTFNTASELDDFEPRMMAAFAQFKHFLTGYGFRPETVYRRF